MFWLILLLGALAALRPFPIDTYLPAFPAIAQSFHTTVGEVEATLAVYFGLAALHRERDRLRLLDQHRDADRPAFFPGGRDGKKWQEFEFFRARCDARRWLDLNQLTAWREHSGGDVCAIFPAGSLPFNTTS